MGECNNVSFMVAILGIIRFNIFIVVCSILMKDFLFLILFRLSSLSAVVVTYQLSVICLVFLQAEML